jgi:glycerate-2-kinase
MHLEEKRALREVFDVAIGAVEPARLVRRYAPFMEVFVEDAGAAQAVLLAFGKAALPMAQAAAQAMHGRCARGLAVAPKEAPRALWNLPPGIEPMAAEHPTPGQGSLLAGRRALDLAAGLERDEALVCLVSGGGSSLVCAPAPGVPLEDKRATTDLLLRSGADIVEMNTVRKHLSAVKGGWLAAAAHPAAVLTMLLSDVVGDPIESIASGPTCADPSTFAEAEEVLRRRGLLDRTPASVRRHLARGIAGEVPETPKPGAPRLARASHRVIGSNRSAMEAAGEFAAARGVAVRLRRDSIVGEASTAGRSLAVEARIARDGRLQAGPPLLLLSGGETTVTVRGNGRGGRNCELALAFALEIAGLPGVRLLSAGTDGKDGCVDAAGAFADGGTVERARAIGLDPADALDRNDSGTLFEALGDLLTTGPTGTNVMDLQLLWIDG